MQLILQSIVSIVIFCPIVLLLFVYFVSKKFGMPKIKAFGYGADVMTFVLLLSIPLVIKSVWDIQLFGYIVLVLMGIAIFISYQEWRTKKEIEIKFVLRKLWRIYFLLLTTIYIIVLIAGLIYNVIQFSKT